MTSSEIWADDRLGRQADAEHLIEILIAKYSSRVGARGGSYILNIDASWGAGKTFFLDRLRAELQSRGHLVASVNAWRDDHADDPLITLMTAIEDELAPNFPNATVAETAWAKGKRAMGVVAIETMKQASFHALKAFTGVSVKETLAALNAAGVLKATYGLDQEAFDDAAEKVWDKSLENLVGERVSENRNATAAIAEFRLQTARAIKAVETQSFNAPMFVFVDELDRCRPTYAIKLLEDMKHLFEIDGLIFIVATDSEQLAHSVRAIYGADFESRKYLRRFFDSVFVFPHTNRSDLVNFILNENDINPDQSFYPTGDYAPLQHILNWSDDLELSNRDLSQVLEILATFVYSFGHNGRIEINYLLACCWAFYTNQPKLLYGIRNGGVEREDFGNWMIRTQVFERDIGPRIGLMPAANFVNKIAGTFSNDLLRLTETADSLLQNYFRQEFEARFPKGILRNEVHKSSLSEYPSRVKNAGRVIDLS